jgi:hypothetical protein
MGEASLHDPGPTRSAWVTQCEYWYLQFAACGQQLLDCHRVFPNHIGAERKQIEVEMILSGKAFR